MYRPFTTGPTVQPHDWEACLQFVDALEPSPRFVVLSGTLPPGVPHDACARLADNAKARGSQVILDTAGPELHRALANGVWIVKPGLRESPALTGRNLANEEPCLVATRELV